jgi:hypothetical protein
MSKSDFSEADEEPIFFDVSDDDLERASGACDGSVPTLVGTYCFTCPSGPRDREVTGNDISASPLGA